MNRDEIPLTPPLIGFVSIPKVVVEDVVVSVDSVEVSIGGFLETGRSCILPKVGNLNAFGLAGFSGLGGVGGEATG